MVCLCQICKSLRPALDHYFPESMGVRIISEPGRFFAASAFTLAVNVIAKREIAAENEGIRVFNSCTCTRGNLGTCIRCN